MVKENASTAIVKKSLLFWHLTFLISEGWNNWFNCFVFCTYGSVVFIYHSTLKWLRCVYLFLMKKIDNILSVKTLHLVLTWS